MTAAKIIDASALAAVLFNEDEADAITERTDGAPLLAPSILSLEITNKCLKKCRHDPGRRDLWVAGLKAFEGRGIKELPVNRNAVLALALETGLTTYDASYLWLALKFDAELVTLDGALARAWRQRAKAG